MAIIYTLKKFNEVVEACFGNTLGQNYQKKIKGFKESDLATSASVSPKVHTVFYHVQHFNERKNSSLRINLVQATEPLHHLFKINWQRFNHPTTNNPGEKLKGCVVDFNSIHT